VAGLRPSSAAGGRRAGRPGIRSSRHHLGLLLHNSSEFHIADTAALLLGATPFSMSNTSAPEQLAHLVTDADRRIIITEAGLLDRLDAALQRCPGTVEDVIVVESSSWSGLFTCGEIEPDR
jgi:long-chain acyl-CoA synthetase